MKNVLRSSLLCLSGALVTCSPPPFNLDISAAARVASKLTLVGRVGPLGDLMMGSEASQGSPDWIFLPEKDGLGGVTLQAGFIYLSTPADGDQVAFIASAGGKYQKYGSSQGLGAVSSDPYPAHVLQSVKSGHNGISFQFDDVTPANNGYTVAQGDTAANTFIPVVTKQLMPIVSAPPFTSITKNVVGLSIYPDPDPTLDRMYWLAREQATTNYIEARLDYNLGGDANPIQLRPGTYDISSFAGTGRVLYYYDPVAGRSYVSVWNSPAGPAGWSTWVWVDNLTVPTHWQLTTIANRVDALLTTGEMFSTEGNVGRVYDPASAAGTLEARFTLGTLRFIGEAYVGATPMVLFSQALWINRELTFNVYSIPTSQLASLAE